jgi:hypothetical protein
VAGTTICFIACRWWGGGSAAQRWTSMAVQQLLASAAYPLVLVQAVLQDGGDRPLLLALFLLHFGFWRRTQHFSSFLVLFIAFGILLLEMFIVDLYKTCSKIIDMHRLAKVALPC